MKKQILSEEFRRMQKLAGIISESQLDSEYDMVEPGYKPKVTPYEILTYDQDVAIFKKDGKLYLFHYSDIPSEDFEYYADKPKKYTGSKDEDGDPIFDYGEWEINDDTLSNYLNDNLDSTPVDNGLEDYKDNESDFVQIDEPLKQYIIKNHPKLASTVKDI